MKIEFRENGIYVGSRNQSGYSWWDIGDYTVTGEKTVKISTANDDIIEYHYEIKGRSLHFIDEKECHFTYTQME
jgi:hypothetical protein